MDEIKEALLSGHGKIALIHTFTHGMCAQVYQKTRKVGPIIVPNQGQTVADVLLVLAAAVNAELETATVPSSSTTHESE